MISLNPLGGKRKYYGSLSHHAEIQLVKPLLELDFFRRKGIQRRLAIYPYENYHNKNELICEIMDLVWPSGKGNTLFPIYKDFEHYLTASGKRGHFIHQFEVFLLGLNILFILWDRSKDRLKDFKVKTRKDLIEAWLLASTTHDLGYPLHEASELIKQLAILYRKLDMTAVADKYEGIKFENILLKETELAGFFIDSTTEGIQTYYSIDYLIERVLCQSLGIIMAESKAICKKFIEEKSHGYVSAKILARSILKSLATNLKTTNFEDEHVFKLLMHALGAIILHDIPKGAPEIAKQLTFSLNPYAYLLYIIDNIQDWSRTIIPNKNYAEYHLLNVQFKPTMLKMDYVLNRESWTESKIQDTEDDIAKRKEKLKLLSGLTNTFNYKIQVTFSRSDAGKLKNELRVNL